MSTDGQPSRSSDAGDTNYVLDFTELNAVHGRYFPMSNACGQFGKLYNDTSSCTVDASGSGFGNSGTDNEEERVDMSCDFDPTLEMDAAPHPTYNYPSNALYQEQGKTHYGPPPFYCEPQREFHEFSGYWDGYLQEFVRDVAYPSALGKVDVEG